MSDTFTRFKSIIDLNENIYQYTKRSAPNSKTFRASAVFLISISFAICAAVYFYSGKCKVNTILCIFLLSIFHLFFCLRKIEEESLLIVHSFGLQTSTVYTVGRSTKFIPWCSIQDVIINEAVCGGYVSGEGRLKEGPTNRKTLLSTSSILELSRLKNYKYIPNFRMVHYLAVIIKDEIGVKSLYPLFMSTRPRLPELKKIYCDVQSILKQ